MFASILLAACLVPERLRMSEISVGMIGNAAAIAQRLKSERFDAVGKSIPPRDPAMYYAHNRWYTRDQLGPEVRTALATMSVGSVVRIVNVVQDTEFIRLDEVRSEMPCDRAVAEHPDDEIARKTRAGWESRSGDQPGAIADYSVVLLQDPDSSDARFGRAYANFASGNNRSALDDLAAPGGNGDIYWLRGLVEEALGQDDLATADEASAISQNGALNAARAAPAHAALGTAYENLGYFSASIAEFDTAIRQNPADANAYVQRGFAWFSQGSLAKAEGDFAAALQVRPAAAHANLDRALLEFSRGNVAESFAFARKAVADDPRDRYATLWVLIAERALHQSPSDAEREDVAMSSAWPDPVRAVFLGRASVDSLESAAVSTDVFTQRIQTCEAHFYAGVYLWTGDQRASALPLLRKALDECPYREVERSTVRQMLSPAQHRAENF